MSDTLTAESWLVLHIDDEQDFLDLVRDIVEALEPVGGRGFQVKSSISFEDGLDLLKKSNPDLIVLDVRAGKVTANIPADAEAGRQLLEQIQAVRFVPVVFYSGLSRAVEDLEAAPLIQVVQKGDGPELFEKAISHAFLSGLPSLRRAMEGHLAKVLRDYMWDFVAPNHETFAESYDKFGYHYLLLRRLSRSIIDTVSKHVRQETGLRLPADAGGGLVPPMRYYIMPPILDATHLTGDIYRADLADYAPRPPFSRSNSFEVDDLQAADLMGYWVLITPACDLAEQRNGTCRADNVILARAERLDDQKEFLAWKAESDEKRKKDERGKVKSLLHNRRHKRQPERFHYLPGAFDLPHLIVDFQQILSIPREALSNDGVVRVATLDEPYGAELVSRFTNYLNRIGSPDLDIDRVIDRL